MNHFVQWLGVIPSNDAASSPSFSPYFRQNGRGTARMAAVQVKPPHDGPLCLGAERPVVAGCVRSRTAGSWRRNSQKPSMHERQLQGNPDDSLGSGCDGRLIGFIAG